MSGIMVALAGGASSFSLSISPTLQDVSGSTLTGTFSAEVVSITGYADSPTYNWTVTPGDEYTWQIVSGQGTDTCVARVLGVASGDVAYATLQCDVTANGITKSISAPLTYTRT